MTPTEERLLALLPSHLRLRSSETGSAVLAVVTAVAAELEILERDVGTLASSWFVETCPEWVVPYIADLVGIEGLPDPMGSGISRRAFVANTVAYRRRKGTVAALEQIARDVTGWPARAVETFRLLATTTHTNHVHVERPALTSVRNASRLDLTGLDKGRAMLDPVTHTAEVRRIPSHRGRYGISNIAIHVIPMAVNEAGTPTPPIGDAGPDGGWAEAHRAHNVFRVDPFGRESPLFALPPGGDDVDHLATEADLPVPLRPRRLLELLRAARAGRIDASAVPVGVRIGIDADLPPAQLFVCGLEDIDPAATVPQVTIDPVRGQLRVTPALASSTKLYVRYSYGSSDDVGAGTYDRTDILDAVMACDPFVGADAVDALTPRFQVAVRTPSPHSLVASPTVVATLAAATTALTDDWTGAHPRALGATAVMSIGDSGRYRGPLRIAVPEGTRLVLVAAAWSAHEDARGVVTAPVPGNFEPAGLRPVIVGDIEVTGGAGSSVVIDGLAVTGRIVVKDGALGSLTVSQCTVADAIEIGDDPSVRLRIARSVVHGIVAPSAPFLDIYDSVVGADFGAGVPRQSIDGRLLRVTAAGTTVRGGVFVRTLDASSCIFDGKVQVVVRQTGCLRYCSTGKDSSTPVRFRCVPPDSHPSDVVSPVYDSLDPAAPDAWSLAASCPPAIAVGGEGGSEMGVHHHLARPLRIAAATRLLAPYLPAGMQAGIFRSTHAR